MLDGIEIEKEISFGELCERLRKVQLRGFPDVCVYENANFEIRGYDFSEIVDGIFTPQPSIYQTHLDKIGRLDKLFSARAIDIFKLDGGYDFVAFDDEGEKHWTIIPPVIERLFVPIRDGCLDYSRMFGDDLRSRLKEENVDLPKVYANEFADLLKLYMDEFANDFCGWNICDGSHRIHFAVLNGIKQNLLFINGIKEGWPYYAIPQPYSKIHIEPERIEDKLDKIHVLPEPYHKWLYRLFPSGGILSGDIRTSKTN